MGRQEGAVDVIVFIGITIEYIACGNKVMEAHMRAM